MGCDLSAREKGISYKVRYYGQKQFAIPWIPQKFDSARALTGFGTF